jgi:hypothetical protein
MDEKGIVIGREVPDLFQPSALGKNRRFIRTDETKSHYPLPVETSVVRRWRRMFSSTTTQFNLMSGLSASNLVESFLEFDHRRVINRCDVTVFCWARTLALVNRTASRGNVKLFIFGFSRSDNPAPPNEDPIAFDPFIRNVKQFAFNAHISFVHAPRTQTSFHLRDAKP